MKREKDGQRQRQNERLIDKERNEKRNESEKQ